MQIEVKTEKKNEKVKDKQNRFIITLLRGERSQRRRELVRGQEMP